MGILEVEGKCRAAGRPLNPQTPNPCGLKGLFRVQGSGLPDVEFYCRLVAGSQHIQVQ